MWNKYKNKDNKTTSGQKMGGSRDFEKGWHSMSATMVEQQRKIQVSDGLERPK